MPWSHTQYQCSTCAETPLLERPRAMMLLTYQYDAPPFRIPVAATGGPMSQALSRGLELWQVPALLSLVILQDSPACEWRALWLL